MPNPDTIERWGRCRMVSAASVLRLLREEGLLLEASYQRERRQLAGVEEVRRGPPRPVASTFRSAPAARLSARRNGLRGSLNLIGIAARISLSSTTVSCHWPPGCPRRGGRCAGRAARSSPRSARLSRHRLVLLVQATLLRPLQF
jgi:hypothetical protein